MLYDIGLNSLNASIYPIPRFASEYGFQSFSSYKVLALDLTDISTDSFHSENILHRQHHTDGQTQIIAQASFHFTLPENADGPGGLETMLFINQITHAICLRAESEHYRRYRSNLLDDNRGHTMGAIYWQLNDMWPGARYDMIVCIYLIFIRRCMLTI